MKILVTGATGYMGTELIRDLLERNHEVIGLYRDKNRIRIPHHPKLTWKKCNLFDPEEMKSCLAGCEIVFHLAAYARVWTRNMNDYYNINVIGTRNLLAAAVEVGVRKLIYTSTAGVLGPSNGNMVDETNMPFQDYFTEYERTKSIAEKLLLDFKKKEMQTIILLPSRIFGPGLLSESNGVTRLIQKYIQGRWRILPGNGKKVGNYAYIRDVVRGHIQALAYNGHNERFILGGTNTDYRELFNTIGVATGKKRWLIPVPAKIILFLSHLLLFYARIMGHPPLITPDWAKKYMHDWRISSQNAIDHLGYQITPMDKAIRETVEWLNTQNYE